MTATLDLPTDRRCIRVKRSGERCKQYAIRGGTVCRMHGGSAPQVARKAAVRSVLQRLIRQGEQRHPWAVLLDALHGADSVMQDIVLRMDEDRDLSPAEVTRFVESLERAARMAKMTIDARAHEYSAVKTDLEVHLIARVLEAGIRALGLEDDRELIARMAMSDELLAIEAEQASRRELQAVEP